MAEQLSPLASESLEISTPWEDYKQIIFSGGFQPIVNERLSPEDARFGNLVIQGFLVATHPAYHALLVASSLGEPPHERVGRAHIYTALKVKPGTTFVDLVVKVSNSGIAFETFDEEVYFLQGPALGETFSVLENLVRPDGLGEFVNWPVLPDIRMPSILAPYEDPFEIYEVTRENVNHLGELLAQARAHKFRAFVISKEAPDFIRSSIRS